MDLEQESTIAVDTGMSSDIADSCNKLIDTQKQLKALDDQITKLQEVERNLSEQTIPNLMQQAGITMLKLADGSSVEITKKYAARIPTSKVDEAHDWLRANGFEDLIKNDLSLSFGMKEDNQAKALAQELIEKGFNVKQKTHALAGMWIEAGHHEAWARHAEARAKIARHNAPGLHDQLRAEN